ncbi:DUF6542 domain-containing protein [Streptomyces antimycoticus]|uniref:DUF6542 domain-containing protein n=1 Tax=Streptomyces TaxID=1883 RepID=UPI000F794E56|nr:DUF6542 domain-containing protein [Streptomyces sp. WAC05858]RSS45339.1 hypothetical protein EF902_14325 [Streptomyces sp. WAC05858]WTA83784.1 hypothetical protein OG751_30050 [Streptomyces antimycoticus]WTB05787.1 hypothetical protein OG546_17095 [Streptomyces antimycoticus]
MEQYSTRTPRRAAAPPPRPAADDTYTGRSRGAGAGQGRGRPGGAVRDARPPARRTAPSGPAAALPAALRRARGLSLPGPRLTGLGAGLLTALTMLGIGCLDALLFSGSPTVYSVLFLPACAACGLWVRPADLLAAPVTAPLAYTVGLLPINDGSAGFSGQAVGVFTALSLQAGWLYAGTLLTVLIVLVRRAVLVTRRRRQQRPRPSRHPRSPRCSEAAPARSRP